MNSGPDREIAIFNGALQLPAAQRMSYLTMACGDDGSLRQRVEQLLKVHEEAGAFLQEARERPQEKPQPPKPRETIRVHALPAEKEGEKIGRYKVLQEIGEGGGGVVYMAQQEEPVKRRVALKVIKLGMDTKQVIARFEAERQALALMDHPNIAKVLDAGATETGRPFFVMELVRGIKITEYCDQNKLSTEERLKLFVQICHAVQHAHQKGIIHRDIKPSNILVTLHDGVPIPKVIDFGIAKATTDVRLTDKTMFTRFEQFIGTPAYMSPEQAEMSGLDIDTRTDIYSLGVLCYELLTGKTPFDAQELQAAGLEQMRRTIRETEPVRPSTRVGAMKGDERTTTAARRGLEAPKLVGLLRGDLDWIVMKALEKDRTHRYETANGLAMDIERHLKNEPVLARPAGKLYRFQKLARRNKLAFAATGAVVASLVVGLSLATWQFVQEKRARKRAVAAESKSQQVTKFLKDILKGVGPGVAQGRDMNDVFRGILNETAERVGKDLHEKPEIAVELLATLGDVYEALGEYVKAEDMYQEALRIEEPFSGVEQQKMVAYLLNHLGVVLWERADPVRAEETQRKALALRKKLFGEASGEVAEAYNDLGLARWQQGDLSGAEELFREGLSLRDRLPEPEKSSKTNEKEVAVSLGNLGQVLYMLGDLEEAEQLQRKALTLRRKRSPPDPVEIAQTLSSFGWALLDRGNFIEAEPAFRESLATVQKVLPAQHPWIGLGLKNLGVLLRRRGASSGDVPILREALQRYAADAYTADAFAGVLARPALTPLCPDSASAGWRHTLAQPPPDWATQDFDDKSWQSASNVFGAPLSWARTLRNPPKITTRTNRWMRREFQLSEVPEGQLVLRVNRNHDAQVFLNGVAIAPIVDWSDTEVLVPCFKAGPKALKAGRNVLALFSPDADGGTRIDVNLYVTTDRTLGRSNLVQELTQMLDREPLRADLYSGRGNALARLGRWKEAGADLARAIELKASTEINWYQLAPVLVESAHLPAYRDHLRKALDQFARPDGPDQAGRIAILSMLTPSVGAELDAAAKLADQAGAADYHDGALNTRQVAKALAEYRRGHFAEAISWSSKTLVAAAEQSLPGWNHERERNRAATAYVLQAMAHHQLNHSLEAQSALRTANEIVQTQFPQIDSGDLGREWHELLVARILLRELRIENHD